MTGKDAKNCLFQDSFEPLTLDAFFYSKEGRHRENYTSVHGKQIRIDLWVDGKPDWVEHPDPRQFDLAAIHLDGIDTFCVNDKLQDDRIWMEVGADCYIVGYPEKLVGPYLTPVWKRGSIATEPSLDFGELPIFLCDSATRKGMSGSPVFIKAFGRFGRQGEKSNDPFFGFWTKFAGIYAGRNGNDDLGFQLGRIWRPELIEEMLSQPKQPNPLKKI